MKSIRTSADNLKVEDEDEYRKWIQEIPFIAFPENYIVQIIPPFAGAIVRFRVALINDKENYISVYLDCYNRLGYFNGPYWEAYPCRGDVFRCGIKEVNKLLKAIHVEFHRRASNE